MRPLKLTMEAFESYLEPQTIDFDPLNAARIFIISGKTGAGKTTIFDAILYALYGELSSEGRNKSKQYKTVGSDDTKYTCKVILDFEQNGNFYRVTRVPAQTMPGKLKGKTKTTSSEIIVLENLSDEKEVIPSKNAQDYLNRLLGLDSKQFRQVCLISQGSFSEVLTANTTEKKKIFRDLFGTGVFDDFVTKLDNEVKKREGNREHEVGELDHLYHTISMKEEDVEERDRHQDHQERLLFLKSKAEVYQKEDEEVKKQLEEMSDRQTALALENSKALEQEKNLKDKAEYEQKLEESEKQCVLIKKELQDRKEQKPEIEKKKEELTSLRNQLNEYEALEETKTCLAKAKMELATRNKESVKAKEDVGFLTQSLTQKQKELEETEKLLSKKEETRVAYVKKENIRKQLADEKKKTEPLKTDILVRLPSALRQKELTEGKEKQIKEDADRMEASYFASVTGILSDHLVDGEPCPVCGSIHHPAPHVHQEEEVTEAEYKKAKEELRKARENTLSSQNTLDHLDENIRTGLQEMKSFLEQFGVQTKSNQVYSETYLSFSNSLNQLIKENEEEYSRLDQEVKALDDLQKKQEHRKKQIQEETDSLQEQEKKITFLAGEIIRLETEEKNYSEIVAEKKKALFYQSKQEADSQIQRLTKGIADYEERLAKTEESYSDAKQTVDSLSGELKRVNESIQAYHGRDKNLIVAELGEVNSIRKNLDDMHTKLVSYHTSIENGMKRYQSKYDDFEKENHEYSLYSNLLNVFKGKNIDECSSTKGVDLETFVLARYLDDIITFGNQRLLVMSDGRYQMERRKDGFKGGGQQGLDIDIVDQYTMESRQAGTLSGGETFMASLSLALGLSDKVRMLTAQKDIDVLFVDEGFGSLDEEALVRAADTLKGLASTDGKTIGLISHVEGLLPLFEMKVTVEKDSEGHSKAILP